MAYPFVLIEILVVINQQDTPPSCLLPYTRNHHSSPLQHDPVMGSGGRRRHLLEQLAKAVPPKVYLLDNSRGARTPEERVRLYAVEKGDELWQASLSWVGSDKGRISVCGWLESHYSLQMLGRYLDRLMIQRHPEHSSIYFRYFDPRTLHHLSLILAPQQLEGLLGLVRRWTYLDINGDRWVLENQGVLKTRFSMEAGQWASVARLSRINLCLRGWKHNVAPAPLPHDASLQVDHFVKMAESYGISDEAELIAFVLHGLATHKRFDRHPVMVEVLRRHRRDGMNYISLTDRFSAQDWMAISREEGLEEGVKG